MFTGVYFAYLIAKFLYLIILYHKVYLAIQTKIPELIYGPGYTITERVGPNLAVAGSWWATPFRISGYLGSRYWNTQHNGVPAVQGMNKLWLLALNIILLVFDCVQKLYRVFWLIPDFGWSLFTIIPYIIEPFLYLIPFNIIFGLIKFVLGMALGGPSIRFEEIFDVSNTLKDLEQYLSEFTFLDAFAQSTGLDKNLEVQKGPNNGPRDAWEYEMDSVSKEQRIKHNLELERIKYYSNRKEKNNMFFQAQRTKLVEATTIMLATRTIETRANKPLDTGDSYLHQGILESISRMPLGPDARCPQIFRSDYFAADAHTLEAGPYNPDHPSNRLVVNTIADLETIQANYRAGFLGGLYVLFWDLLESVPILLSLSLIFDFSGPHICLVNVLSHGGICITYWRALKTRILPISAATAAAAATTAAVVDSGTAASAVADSGTAASAVVDSGTAAAATTAAAADSGTTAASAVADSGTAAVGDGDDSAAAAAAAADGDDSGTAASAVADGDADDSAAADSGAAASAVANSGTAAAASAADSGTTAAATAAAAAAALFSNIRGIWATRVAQNENKKETPKGVPSTYPGGLGRSIPTQSHPASLPLLPCVPQPLRHTKSKTHNAGAPTQAPLKFLRGFNHCKDGVNCMCPPTT